MEYEQRYKEALKVMEGLYNVVKYQSSYDALLTSQTIEKSFPELKESEDEKIRKEIIQSIQDNMCVIHKDKCIAWLEKQDKKPNNVKPNFKDGDWIVCFDEDEGETSIPEKVVDFSGNKVRLIDTYGVSMICPKNVLNQYHLWTIQDAKDGDVLCTYECDEPKIVFILKGTPKKHYALSYHCYYNIMYPHFESDSEKGCLGPNDEDVKPATKEQCDILFKKMKDAGYEWDVEKKELKKIEDSCYYNDGLYYAMDILEKALGKVEGYQTDDGILEHKCAISTVKKLAEQGTTWSEEDEIKIEKLLKWLRLSLGYNDERLQSEAKEMIDWLKSIKDIAQSQQKQVWSEEDEQMIRSIRCYLNEFGNWLSDKNEEKSQSIYKACNWLKSIKPNHWKPTEEQLKSLQYATGNDGTYNKEALKRLYNDLKSL